MLAGGNVQSWHCYSFWPVQRFPGIASSSRQEALMQKMCCRVLFHLTGVLTAFSPAAAIVYPPALNNSVPESELKHPCLSARPRPVCPELSTTSVQRNSQTASLLSANACRKHLRRFYGTSSNLQAWMLIVTCCCGNHCTVCKYFTDFFSFLARWWKPLRHSMQLSWQSFLGAVSITDTFSTV